MKTRERVLLKTGGRCAYCGADLEMVKSWHVEHMTPVSKGGGNNLTNLVPACYSCNTRKRTKTVDEFRQWLVKKVRESVSDDAHRVSHYLDDESCRILMGALAEFLQVLEDIEPRVRFYLDGREL